MHTEVLSVRLKSRNKGTHKLPYQAQGTNTVHCEKCAYSVNGDQHGQFISIVNNLSYRTVKTWWVEMYSYELSMLSKRSGVY